MRAWSASCSRPSCVVPAKATLQQSTWGSRPMVRCGPDTSPQWWQALPLLVDASPYHLVHVNFEPYSGNQVPRAARTYSHLFERTRTCLFLPLPCQFQ